MDNSTFCGRNMKNPLDWKLIRSVAKLETSVAKLETSMAGMQNDIKEIKDLLISHFSNRNMKMIGKKRKRSRRQNN